MRRVAFAGIAVAVALATAAAASSTRGPAVAVPHGVRAPAQRGPLLAVFQRRRGAVLGWLDKRALVLARGSPRLVLPHSLDAWAYSSDRNVLALGTVTLRGANNPIPWLQFVDPKSLRRLARTPLGSGYVAAIGWGSDRVNVLVERWCCPQSFDAASIDSSSHRLVSKQHLENAILQLQRVGGSIVLLTGPAAGIGTAGLTVVDPDGTLRSVVLSQIQAGRDVLSEDGSNLTKAQQNIPGLAVDPASGRAFVVSASGAVAEISLASLAVSYPSVSQPVSLLGRLHDLVEPKAEAKGFAGPGRSALWLGNGVLAVYGDDETVSTDPNGSPVFIRKPAGVRFIDTGSWGSKSLDSGADALTLAGDHLLVTGSSWDSQTQGEKGIGLIDYAFDGTRRLALFPGRLAYVSLVFGGRAYVYLDGVAKVIDLASGRLLRDRRAPLPLWLLAGDGSP